MAVTTVTRTLQLLSCDFCGTVHASENEARGHGCLSGPPKRKFAIGDKVFVTIRLDGYEPRNVPCRVTSVRSPRASGWTPEAKLPVARFHESDRDHLAVALSSHPHTWVVCVESEEDQIQNGEVSADAVLLPSYVQEEVSPRRERTTEFAPVSIRPSLRPAQSMRTEDLIQAVSGRTQTPTLPCAAW